MATLAPSEARRLAIAAPIPREPPVTSAALLVKFDMFRILSSRFTRRFSTGDATRHRAAVRDGDNMYVRIEMSSDMIGQVRIGRADYLPVAKSGITSQKYYLWSLNA